MNQKISPLIELQKLDLRIMEINEIRRKIPERLHAAETPLRNATQILNDTTATVEVAVKERRSHEKDLEAHEVQTDKMKSRLSELKTNKEYQAHLFEIELSNKKRGDFEEKILVCMEKIDQLQRTAKETQEKVKALQTVFAQEKSVLDEQDRTLAAELAQLEVKQREASARVEKSLLERYSQIKAARKDQALAAVRGGICAGCRLQIPPQLIAQVKRSEDLHVCPYCRRMLYWEGEPVAETPAVPGDKSADLEVGESV
ncbi:MAG TPA: C4-type zinc ribbon domain-containing protein [Nitrospiraceae bacterium]|nr:C4-type zinc ribbon domain-containing protein [Nitrospiraceae bacterium]